MKKGTIITFVLSVIVFLAIGFIIIILITPQANPGVYTKTEYDALSKNDYVFVPTKDITADGVEQNYEVDREYLNNLEKNQGYKPRKNNNPFSNGNTSSQGNNNNNNNNNNNSNPNNNNNNNNNENSNQNQNQDQNQNQNNNSTDAPDNNPSSPNAETNAPTNTGK